MSTEPRPLWLQFFFEITIMIDGERFAGGLELNFFESSAFEEMQQDDSIEYYNSVGRNALRMLMMGWHDNWQQLLTWQLAKAVFIERDHKLTRGMRFAFQQGFDHLFDQLQGTHLTEQEQHQAELFLANCLTLLPYADITPYETFAIPQWVDGSWQKVDYKVVPIELTPTSGLKSLFIRDNDRVFAYGLEPITHPTAESHLVFMGTTYPAGQGFSPQIATDMEAFETVGKKLYRSGHANIVKWLDSQAKPVHVCGTSLGGSLSLLLALITQTMLPRQ